MYKIYLSGAITGNESYMQDFQRAEDKVKEFVDAEIINPAKILKDMPESASYKDYMTLCIELIRQADEVYMIRGWEESKGAVFERHLAQILDKAVTYELQ